MMRGRTHKQAIIRTLHFFYKDNFVRTTRLRFLQKVKDNIRKFKDKLRIILGLKSKNSTVDIGRSIKSVWENATS